MHLSHLHHRPLLSTPQGGHVALDSSLLALWQYANGRTLDEVVTGAQPAGTQTSDLQIEYANPHTIRAALACLCEAGLLSREFAGGSEALPSSAPPSLGRGERTPTVAAIIVNYNSRDWLAACVPSLLAQTYPVDQVIVVDNGSHDGALEWLEANHPAALRLQIDQPASLAHAINAGIALASPGNHLLVLNPDIYLEPTAVAQMVSVAQSDPQCAAVAAKLYFSWAPTFLNGLGNQVSSLSWGSDIALGHLDLGQYDSWRELPSACFAAALLTRSAWPVVSPLDEDFPMYYEDAEWCYRARLLGYKILAAPQAIVHHAFGGSGGPIGQSEGLSQNKLANVVYGRLRFSLKLLDKQLPRFVRNYLAEDCLNFFRYLSTGKWTLARAYLAGWKKTLASLPAILSQRRLLQSRRQIADHELFSLQRDTPMPFSWCGLPELTWDLVFHHYAPLIQAERTRPMPEFESRHRRPHLLIVSPEGIDDSPGGSYQARLGVFCLEMARSMQPSLDVTLAVPSHCRLPEIEKVPGLHYVHYSEERVGSLQILIENSDSALLFSTTAAKMPVLEYTQTRLVIALYDSNQEPQGKPSDPEYSRQPGSHANMDAARHALRVGDFFICHHENQRDFWLGALAANGRINPFTTGQDASLRQLIDVVSLNVPSHSPQEPPPAEAGWERNIEPLRRYCLGDEARRPGSYAPDRYPRPTPPLPPPIPPQGLFPLAMFIWRT